MSLKRASRRGHPTGRRSLSPALPPAKKWLAEFSSLLLCGSLLQACGPDTGPTAPDASRVVEADAVADEQSEWGPWSTPINLGPVVNSPADDNRPAISKDGLSLYITSGRLGGFGGLDIS